MINDTQNKRRHDVEKNNNRQVGTKMRELTQYFVDSDGESIQNWVISSPNENLL